MQNALTVAVPNFSVHATIAFAPVDRRGVRSRARFGAPAFAVVQTLAGTPGAFGTAIPRCVGTVAVVRGAVPERARVPGQAVGIVTGALGVALAGGPTGHFVGVLSLSWFANQGFVVNVKIGQRRIHGDVGPLVDGRRHPARARA